MSAIFSGQELTAASGGKWLPALPAAEAVFSIATDSRRDCTGTLFLALKGENFDGHNCLAQALERGAAALCVESPHAEEAAALGVPVLVVGSTMKAYHNIARFHRLRFKDLTVIGLTGSVGKTSVKEMLRAICTAACDGNGDAVLATPGNRNNHFGVPDTLLMLTENHRYAVIEMGTSGPGEIAVLTEMVEPDVALVNSIAACHLERLKTLDGVALEKSQIFSALKPAGIGVIPADSPGHNILKAALPVRRRMEFGHGGTVDYRYLGGNLSGSAVMLKFPDGREYELIWRLSGEHQAVNASAAATAGIALGLSPETIIKGLANTELPGMRMNVIKCNGANWILDAYNANPESMRAALSWLSDFTEPDKTLVILGDMLELGASEQLEHYHILAELVRQLPDAAVILVGAAMSNAAGLLPPSLQEKWQTFDSSEAAAPAVAATVQPGWNILVKGSRGIMLEKAVPEEVKRCADGR